MSKRKMCFVPASLAIFDYEDRKQTKSNIVNHTSVLGFKCVDGKHYPGWRKKYPEPSSPLISVQRLAINLGKHFACKKLRVESPKPLIPAGFKLIRIKPQSNKPCHTRRPWKLFPLRPSMRSMDPPSSTLTFINSFKPGAPSLPPTTYDSPSLVDYWNEPLGPIPSPLTLDDTPPLVDYWSDSSSDDSAELKSMTAPDAFEFVGSGPKSRKKDGRTVAGAFKPLSSYWPVYPIYAKRLPVVPSHTQRADAGPSITNPTDHDFSSTHNTAAPITSHPTSHHECIDAKGLLTGPHHTHKTGLGPPLIGLIDHSASPTRSITAPITLMPP